jgi:hypothetical protein
MSADLDDSLDGGSPPSNFDDLVAAAYPFTYRL